MIFFESRIEREKQTVGAMIKLYCRLKHCRNGSLCEECSTMYDYVMRKLDKCPFDEDKPTCLNCSIHCYKSTEREKIRQIMRYTGPKMIWHHPVLAIYHIIDNRKSNKVVAMSK